VEGLGGGRGWRLLLAQEEHPLGPLQAALEECALGDIQRCQGSTAPRPLEETGPST